MYSRETRVLLRHYLEQGVGKAELARRFGVSRRTVYHWIETEQLDRDLDDAVVTYTPRPPVVRKLDAYRGIIQERLQSFPRLTAERIFEEIRAAGYAGGYTQIKEYVRQIRPRPIEEAVRRFETPPGFQGQVDYATFNLPWGRRYALVVVLGYSRLLWLRFFPRQTMQALFGHRLFTVLVFDAQQRLLKRVYSNSPEVSPVGGAKRVGDSPWARQTLLEGRFHVGSTRADLKSVFSEYERLWAHGCESVLNVPVRADGVTIATLNLLGKAHQYDGCDLVLARLFAQLLAQPLARILRQEAFDAPPAGVLDTV